MSTIIRPLVGVYAVVPLKIGLAIEALRGHSQPSSSRNHVRGATRKQNNWTHTFGQSSHEHSKGLADGMPVEASRSETAAFAIE